MNPLMERSLESYLPSDSDLSRYIFPITDGTPVSLLGWAEEADGAQFKRRLLQYIKTHKVQKAIAEFEARFTLRPLDPVTLSLILKTVRHYHNGLRGRLLYLSGRITEDQRVHRSKRDRIGAAAPLLAAFDEFTDNPNYALSLVLPLIRVVFQETATDLSEDDVVAILARSGLLRRDEPHLERFYGVVEELYRAGALAASPEEMDQENPLESLPARAVPAYMARKILTTRPDLSYAAVCAFMFGNETVAGLLYGKLYKGFKKFQEQYRVSDHACDYFGDHASEDGEVGGPAFEETHANLMLNSVLMYAELGKRHREQIVKGLHLFLETYHDLVESLCEVMNRGDELQKKISSPWGIQP